MHHLFMAEAKKATREALKVIGYDIMDYTSDKAGYPLIRFGYCYESKYPNKTVRMKKVTLTIDIWSNKRGSAETMTISHDIESALSSYKSITEDKYKIVDITIGTIDILEEALKVNESNRDAKLFHGVLPVEFLMMEVI